MKLRDALIQQGPSLELQRAAGDEIARLDRAVTVLRKALADAYDVLSVDIEHGTGRVCAAAARALEVTDPLLPPRPLLVDLANGVSV